MPSTVSCSAHPLIQTQKCHFDILNVAADAGMRQSRVEQKQRLLQERETVGPGSLPPPQGLARVLALELQSKSFQACRSFS